MRGEWSVTEKELRVNNTPLKQVLPVPLAIGLNAGGAGFTEAGVHQYFAIATHDIAPADSGIISGRSYVEIQQYDNSDEKMMRRRTGWPT
jgi:hypothetical protein